jgi:hypothetical protein
MRKRVSAWWKRFGLAVGLLGLWGLGLGAGGQVQAAEEKPAEPVLQGKYSIPKSAELAKAEKLVLEIFGVDISQAKTASQKSALAREILRQAREEANSANKYMALQVAKRLAISAGDFHLGAEILAEIADVYQWPYKLSPPEALQELDRLWKLTKNAQTPSIRTFQQLRILEILLHFSPDDPHQREKCDFYMKSLLQEKPCILITTTSQLPDHWKNVYWMWGISKDSTIASPQGYIGLPERCLLRCVVRVQNPRLAILGVTAHGCYHAFANDVYLGKDCRWESVEIYPLLKFLKDGENIITIAGWNGNQTGGIWAFVEIHDENGVQFIPGGGKEWQFKNDRNEWEPVLGFTSTQKANLQELVKKFTVRRYPD